MRGCRLPLIAVGCVVGLLLTGAARLAVANAEEATVKAGYLYNFGRFVDWPSGSFEGRHSPFVIGILGKDPISDILDRAVAKRLIQGRKAAVRRFPKRASTEDLLGCHILLVSSSAGGETARILRALDGSSVLTVGDDEDFARSGGMVSFRLENSRVILDLNLDATTRARLEVSAQLKQVARIVKTER